MRRYLKTHIIAAVLVFCIVDGVILFLMRSPNPDSAAEGMLPRLIMIVILGVLLPWLGLFKTAGLQKKGFWNSLLLGLPLIIVSLLVLLGSLRNRGNFLGLPTVLIYSLNMLIVGIHEELLVRGFVLNAMLKRWQSSRSGVIGSVVFSSGIFGLLHLTNLASASVADTLAQVIYSIFIGVFFASIFVRTRNIYGLAFLHAFVDWCFYFVVTCFQTSSSSAKSDPLIIILVSLVFFATGLLYLRRSRLPMYSTAEDGE